MKSFWFLIFAFLSITNVYGQSYSGVIVDDQNQVLANVQIRDTVNNITAFSNADGRFTIKSEINGVFEVYKSGYEQFYYHSLVNVDTIQIYLESRVLNSVEVNSSTAKSILDRLNVNVLDYIVYEEFVLTLYSYKSEKFLSLENSDAQPRNFSLGKLKAKSLFEDCYGNVHILTKDRAYQIWIDDKLSFISNVDLEKFNEILAPCIASIDSNFVISSYSNHQKKYTLAIKKNGENQFTPFFNSWDHEEEVAAKALYWEIIALYMSSVDTVSNIIKNKMWDWKNMRELAANYELVVRIGFYEGVIGKEIEVQSFQVNDHVFAFDLCFDSLHIFNKDGNQLFQTDLQGGINIGERTIVMDKMLNNFYLLHFNKGIYSVSQINLTNGQFENSFQLNDIPFAENIQIFNGWIYYLISNNGYRKLYRKKI